MKVVIICNPNDHKLRADSYSQTYRRMLMALIEKFKSMNDSIQMITEDADALDFDADAILFYDIHSTHHISIRNIEKVEAVKYEYFDDPHQQSCEGRYANGLPVKKLGPRERCIRALERDVNFIICPYYDAYFRYLAPSLGNQAEEMLVNFPVCPDPQLFTKRATLIRDRPFHLLANGAVACDNDLYDLRKWAFCHPKVTHVKHSLHDSQTPKGESYPDGLLSQFSSGLAMASMYAVPKYFEMPLAGCVTFMQWNSDAYKWGFRDYENCIFVEKSNFNMRIEHFLNHIIDYQSIASRGQELVEHHYTAQHFADFIYNHIQSRI